MDDAGRSHFAETGGAKIPAKDLKDVKFSVDSTHSNGVKIGMKGTATIPECHVKEFEKMVADAMSPHADCIV